ncbi:UNVERIFIED_CONTAM: hypothetical protein Slati_1071200 [Sesamum latifolium]|uniref:Uncharacterized protein n=1 Tax=Sesamum latifolium TaxID=2727402 RepID=A0AAW2XZH6_9LAMI
MEANICLRRITASEFNDVLKIAMCNWNMNSWEQEPKLNSSLAQRDDHFSRLAQTPDQILAARSDFFVGQSEGFVPSMNIASQHPVNNTLGPHYISNSYSFAGKAGNSLGTLQQGSGSVPVV